MSAATQPPSETALFQHDPGTNHVAETSDHFGERRTACAVRSPFCSSNENKATQSLSEHYDSFADMRIAVTATLAGAIPSALPLGGRPSESLPADHTLIDYGGSGPTQTIPCCGVTITLNDVLRN